MNLFRRFETQCLYRGDTDFPLDAVELYYGHAQVASLDMTDEGLVLFVGGGGETLAEWQAWYGAAEDGERHPRLGVLLRKDSLRLKRGVVRSRTEWERWLAEAIGAFDAAAERLPELRRLWDEMEQEDLDPS